MPKRTDSNDTTGTAPIQKKLKFGHTGPREAATSSLNLATDDGDDVTLDLERQQRVQQEQADAELARKLAQSEGTTLHTLKFHERHFGATKPRATAAGGIVHGTRTIGNGNVSSTLSTSRASSPSSSRLPRQRTVSAKSETETISLVDEEDDDDDEGEGDDHDDDDIVITGYAPATSSKLPAKPSLTSAPIASLFQSPTKKSAVALGKVKEEDQNPTSASTSKLNLYPFLASPGKALASSSKTLLGTPKSAAGPTGVVLPLDTSIFTFDPSSNVDISSWSTGRIPYSYLAAAFALISTTKSRLFISRVLTNLFRVAVELDPESLESVVYLCSNRIGPAHERDLELGVGPQVLSKAFKEVSGLTPQALRQLNKLGDPGDVAYEMKKSVRLLVPPPPLVCHSLFAQLHIIARLKGSGSLERKTSIVKRLLVSAQGEEARYLIRTLVGNLRIGAVRLTIITALAKAFCLSRKGGHQPASDDFYIFASERKDMTDEFDAKKGLGKTKEKVKGDKERLLKERLDRAEAVVRKVWARHPDYGHVVVALLDHGIALLEQRVPLAVGTPLEPMLGSITRDLSEIYARLGSRPFVSEAKLDGQRGQIHVSTIEPSGLGDNSRGKWYDPPQGNTDQTRIWIRCFSRHLEDMSDKYPDIAPTLASLVHRETAAGHPLENFILDCEIVAIDPQTSEFKTFQELSYRSKKDVQMGDIKVRVGIFGFDLMYLNEETYFDAQSLLNKSFRQRRNLLYERFSPLRPKDPRYAKWELVPSCMDNDITKVQEFFQEALKMRAEGIMVKLLDEVELEEDPDNEMDTDPGEDLEEKETEEKSELDSPPPSTPPPATKATPTHSPIKGQGRRRKILPATYEPDKRADSWLKVKKDYLDDLGDSLDLIPIGAWHGNGRKAQWWSPILLGVYDPESGQIQAVCKCMSGFTDDFYKGLNVKYAPDREFTSRSKPPEIEAAGLRPSIWFKPNEVWEMRGADFTLSPVYPAAQHILGERGVSVRFPRFIKVREDKSIEQATTTEQLAEMYQNQGQHH
ncbi:BQ2448_6597 [Microbotryum intermedium]|uniref:BQ2448_6597 protein n=1 Tax=Microbotryum intermedium TaxID=269621 RepID=A0A238FLX3_9BASI|nr:BQ2448_6597 [Microbotryum intermedium]